MNLAETKRPQRPEAPNSVAASILIARREILAQVRSKSFVISTIVILVIVLGGILISGFVSGGGEDATRLAIQSSQANLLEGAPGLELVEADDETEVRRLVSVGDVAAGIVADSGAGNPLGFKIIAHTEEPLELIDQLAFRPPVEVLNPPVDNGVSFGLRYLVSLAFGLIFMMASVTFGSTIAQNTVQEKQSRVVEILLSSVSARALLAGKVLGNSILAFMQVAAIAIVAVLGLLISGQGDILSLVSGAIAWFVAFFLVGFVLLAAIFAASASLVSRIEDTGTVLTPAIMLIMIPYMLVVFFNDNPLVMTIMSYVPFSAPVGMPVRLFLGEAAWWEPLLSLAILALTTWGVIAIGAKIYERSVLRTGVRLKLREVMADSY